MSILPPRLLHVFIDSADQFATWDVDDGSNDPYIGRPYQWNVVFEVTAQKQSSHITRSPGFYTGLDIQVGDWISPSAGGRAWRIISIDPTTDDSTVTCVVEDVDRFNLFVDPTGRGTSDPPSSVDAFVFQLGDDGLPILTPIEEGVLSASWQVDTISRFRSRNLLKSYRRVDQPSHGFAVGDIIYLSSDGVFHQATGDLAGKPHQALGAVNTIGTPGPDWFTYKPIGTVIEGISPALPGAPGDLIYLDPTTPGGRTATKPNIFAKPIYLQLEVDTTGLLLDRNLDGVDPTIGYTNLIYVVPDMASRDALDPKLNLGDQVYVTDGGNSNAEWSHYIYLGSNTFTLLVDKDASTVDASTDSLDITNTSGSGLIIADVSSGRRVSFVSVEVTTPFDGTATLTVGDDGDNARLMDTTENDLSTLGDYTTTPTYEYITGLTETKIKLYTAFTGVTAGAARVTISYA